LVGEAGEVEEAEVEAEDEVDAVDDDDDVDALLDPDAPEPVLVLTEADDIEIEMPGEVVEEVAAAVEAVLGALVLTCVDADVDIDIDIDVDVGIGVTFRLCLLINSFTLALFSSIDNM
jgi:predicted sugar kinase